MSHPARDPRSGIDGTASAASRRRSGCGVLSTLAEAAE
jgi:hypothetical protein